jgi:hypothetical protein
MSCAGAPAIVVSSAASVTTQIDNRPSMLSSQISTGWLTRGLELACASEFFLLRSDPETTP